MDVPASEEDINEARWQICVALVREGDRVCLDSEIAYEYLWKLCFCILLLFLLKYNKNLIVFFI
jgi:hypothetical protein